jgi:predicted GH43/DUF377 family glycosyl hydrolase
MRWIKKGLIFTLPKKLDWMMSHAQLPSPFLLSDGIVRVFFASRDKNQYSHIGYVDFNLKDNFKVINYTENPVLCPGDIGFFDEHGVFPSSVIYWNDKVLMYYIGWNQGKEPPLFYASIGLAVSEDNGNTFRKISKAPILSRSEYDPCLVTSPNVFIDGNILRMTYVSGIKWERINGRLQSYYHIKYAESSDGINWKRDGKIMIDFSDDTETNIARSSVIREGNIYKMWYSFVRGENKYRIGYAESSDFNNWVRKDDKVGIQISSEGFDNEMMCYPSIIEFAGVKYMFYNGNNFGKEGIGLAFLE